MKYLFFIAIFLIPSIVVADEIYLVMQWNNSTRIVLQDKICVVPGLKGSRAAVQRTDGAFIRGCWTYIENGTQIKIIWDNKDTPGDFAVLETKWFNAERE